MLLNVFIHLFHPILSSPSLEPTRSKEDATVIFRDAALYNMTDAGHVWIVTEQALFSNNTPVGTLGLKLNNDNETEHIRVSRFDYCARLRRKAFFPQPHSCHQPPAEIDRTPSSKSRLFK
jgi:hypothetical protein